MTAFAWRLSDLVRGEGNPNHDPATGRFASGMGFQSFHEDFKSPDDLIAGFMNGDLLVHARIKDGTDFRYGIDPSNGAFVKSTDAYQSTIEIHGEAPELTFFSGVEEGPIDSWSKFFAKNDKPVELVFVKKSDDIQKSLGDGKVMDAGGKIRPYEMSPLADYENPLLRNEPAYVEKGDWYTTNHQDVVGVLDVASDGTVAQTGALKGKNPEQRPAGLKHIRSISKDGRRSTFAWHPTSIVITKQPCEQRAFLEGEHPRVPSGSSAGGEFTSGGGGGPVEHAEHAASARIAVLQKATKAKTRDMAVKVMTEYRDRLTLERAAMHGASAGQSTVFSNDDALKLVTIDSEQRGIEQAISNTQDIENRTWRQNLKEWFTGTYVVKGSGEGAATANGNFARESYAWGKKAESEWSSEHTEQVRTALAALPKMGDLRTDVMLMPTATLSVLGQYHSMPNNRGVLVLYNNAPKDDEGGGAAHVALHEFGHGVDNALFQAYTNREETSGLHRYPSDAWRAGREKLEAEYDAIRGSSADSFGTIADSGRRWGGHGEQFAEDFADAYGGNSKKFTMPSYGNVGHMTDGQKARFRQWIESTLNAK